MIPSAPFRDPSRRLRQEALSWFVRRQGGAWTPSLEQDFQRWLASDPRLPGLYDQCGRHWQAADGMPDDLVQRLHENLARDKGQLLPAIAGVITSGVESTRWSLNDWAVSRRALFRPALGLAGVLLVGGGSGYAAWSYLQAPLSIQAYATERGQQKEVRLADGSTIRMDTATRLEVTFYRGHRDVRLLDGQAVFSVEPDADRPFHVLAGPVHVTVVGTVFSVRHTPQMPGSPGVDVAVEKGRVRVAPLGADGREDPARTVLLTAAQQVSSDGHGDLTAVQDVPSQGIAPWRDNRISFVDETLGHVLAELERYGSMQLAVDDPAVAALRLSGTFNPMDRASIRLALSRVLPVRLVERGAQTELVMRR